MELQLILSEHGIVSLDEFKLLSFVQRKQLSITLSKYYGVKIAPRDAFSNFCSVNLWRVIEGNDSENYKYDLWEINSNSGIVFNCNSIATVGVAMIESRFEAEDAEDIYALELSRKLQNAEKINLNTVTYKIDEAGHIIDFNSPTEIPDSILKWRNFLRKFKVSESFINKYSRYFDKKCWRSIGQHSVLSRSVIKRYSKKFGWKNLCYYQNLSEDLIREFQEDVDWNIVSQKQKLSESFIREFSYKVSWKDVTNYQNLSDNFRREFEDKIDITSAINQIVYID